MRGSTFLKDGTSFPGANPVKFVKLENRVWVADLVHKPGFLWR